MLDNGCPTRSIDPRSGRQAQLGVTPKGQRLHVRIVPRSRFKDWETSILAVLDASERKLLDGLLTKIVFGMSR